MSRLNAIFAKSLCSKGLFSRLKYSRLLLSAGQAHFASVEALISPSAGNFLKPWSC